MEPKILLGAKGFKATSGNIVIHVTNLGPNGMHCAWDMKPTEQDTGEFTAWVASQMGEINATLHNGGKAAAQQAYKKWKEQNDARIPGEED